MLRFRTLGGFAVACVLLGGCDADWSAPAEPLAVSNASNGQPMPASSLPRGASSYGNPPNAMALPRLGTH